MLGSGGQYWIVLGSVGEWVVASILASICPARCHDFGDPPHMSRCDASHSHPVQKERARAGEAQAELDLQGRRMAELEIAVPFQHGLLSCSRCVC